MIAIFTDKTVADSYCDKIHNYLLSNCHNYQAVKWATPTENIDSNEWFVKIPVEQTIIDASEIGITNEVDNSKQTKDLPEVGQEVVIGEYYLHQGHVLKCRKTHNLTIYHPKDTPDLFTFFRDNTDLLQWIPNELVETGWKRWYNGIQYEQIQPSAILTVEGQTPDITTSVWTKVQTEDIIDWYQPTGAHDAFRINTLVRYTDAKVYKSLIDYNTYSPEAYPAGWELQPDLV